MLIIVFMFSFVSRQCIIAFGSNFLMVALKPLSDHSRICLISVLVAVDCLYLLSCDLPGSWYDERFLIISWTLWILSYGTLDSI